METLRSGMLPRSRPNHIFVDVLDRLPASIRVDLEKKQDEILQLWNATKLEFKNGSVDKAVLHRWEQRLSKRYMQELAEILRDVEFNAEAFCEVHGRKCPISPRDDPDPSYREVLWVEACGTTCVSWSAMGSKDKWLSA